jgi:hypothetical protein
LRQQTWWADAVAKATPAAGAASDANAIRTFCQAIRHTIAGLGLSEVDARLVSYAVGHSDIVSPVVGDAMDAQNDCKPTS